MPVAASPKYLAEHMGLPYHQSAIRNKEYPPEVAKSEREQLSEGSRKFLRYSYGDLLTHNKDYKVIYRIWAGTQRVLLWGDPVLAAGYGKSSMFAGSDGVEWLEPQSWKGRMGTGIPGQRFTYQKHGLATKQDWRKYDYQYRVWGRLLYNPEAPRQSWLRWLERECGDAAGACETALSLASRVLPLVTLTHGPSASNNHYWPEIYTNLGLIDGSGNGAYAFDMEGPVRFGNAPTFDSALFATAREYAELLLAGKSSHRYTPLDVADWLEGLAEGCERALTEARSAADWGRAEVQRIMTDVAILAGMARHFTEKFRAACWAELFVATKASVLIEPMLDHARRAVLAWEGLAAVSRDLLLRRHHLRPAKLAAWLVALPPARDAGRAARPRSHPRPRRHRVRSGRRGHSRRHRRAQSPASDACRSPRYWRRPVHGRRTGESPGPGPVRCPANPALSPHQPGRTLALRRHAARRQRLRRRDPGRLHGQRFPPAVFRVLHPGRGFRAGSRPRRGPRQRTLRDAAQTLTATRMTGPASSPP